MMEQKMILNDDELSKVSGGYGSDFGWPGASDIMYRYIPQLEDIRLSLTDAGNRQLDNCVNLLRRIAYSGSYEERQELACDLNIAINMGAISEYRDDLQRMMSNVHDLIQASR